MIQSIVKVFLIVKPQPYLSSKKTRNSSTFPEELHFSAEEFLRQIDIALGADD